MKYKTYSEQTNSWEPFSLLYRGEDGLTPRLKIENGHWWISYDGIEWSELGVAIHEDIIWGYEE